MSFADLCLVMLAFLLLLQANRGNPAAVGAGIRAAFAGRAAPAADERLAAPMFEPGEAILLPVARADMAAIGRVAAARGATIRIDSEGSDERVGDGGAQRFDGWELSAARAAAVARAIHAGGLDPARIDVAVGGTRDMAAGAGAAGVTGQRLRITTSR